MLLEKNFICINFATILITFSGYKMSMKKVIILVVLLLTTMAHTAFAEQRGVFMEFHRKINPGKKYASEPCTNAYAYRGGL